MHATWRARACVCCDCACRAELSKGFRLLLTAPHPEVDTSLPCPSAGRQRLDLGNPHPGGRAPSGPLLLAPQRPGLCDQGAQNTAAGDAAVGQAEGRARCRAAGCLAGGRQAGCRALDRAGGIGSQLLLRRVSRHCWCRAACCGASPLVLQDEASTRTVLVLHDILAHEVFLELSQSALESS